MWPLWVYNHPSVSRKSASRFSLACQAYGGTAWACICTAVGRQGARESACPCLMWPLWVYNHPSVSRKSASRFSLACQAYGGTAWACICTTVGRQGARESACPCLMWPLWVYNHPSVSRKSASRFSLACQAYGGTAWACICTAVGRQGARESACPCLMWPLWVYNHPSVSRKSASRFSLACQAYGGTAWACICTAVGRQGTRESACPCLMWPLWVYNHPSVSRKSASRFSLACQAYGGTAWACICTAVGRQGARKSACPCLMWPLWVYNHPSVSRKSASRFSLACQAYGGTAWACICTAVGRQGTRESACPCLMWPLWVYNHPSVSRKSASRFSLACQAYGGTAWACICTAVGRQGARKSACPCLMWPLWVYNHPSVSRKSASRFSLACQAYGGTAWACICTAVGRQGARESACPCLMWPLWVYNHPSVSRKSASRFSLACQAYGGTAWACICTAVGRQGARKSACPCLMWPLWVYNHPCVSRKSASRFSLACQAYGGTAWACICTPVGRQGARQALALLNII